MKEQMTEYKLSFEAVILMDLRIFSTCSYSTIFTMLNKYLKKV